MIYVQKIEFINFYYKDIIIIINMFISLVVFLSSLMFSNAHPTFFEWMKTHNKVYSSDKELKIRKEVYDNNVAKIKSHNLAGHSWTMDVNKFADLTSDEFKNMFSLCSMNPKNKTLSFSKSYVSSLPLSIDWTTKNVITPVKNQGQCGSCWAFSTTGSVEGAHAIQTGDLISLSEQQLVDCAGAEGNQGCNGGMMDYAFQYIIDNGGIGSESSYPYVGVDGTCKTVPSVVTIHGYQDVQPNIDTAFMEAISKQPVSVAVEADQASFQFYSGGVMTAACGTNLDHGVLAVGYGTMNGNDYWKVKNSWGPDWGMNGYILLGRGNQYDPNGQCGILMSPSYPLAVARS
jgi:hypothetical protein